MAIVVDTELLEGLQEAVKKANDTNTAVLFSKVVQMQALSPLSFYEIGRERYLGERLFWQEPDTHSSIVGLGKVETIQTEPSEDRYKSISFDWNEVIKNSIVQSENKHIPATGPILFGGFSFDCGKSQSLLWDHFGDNFFYIPQYMMTLINDQAFYTTNILCLPGGNIKRLIEAYEQGEQLIQTIKGQKVAVSNMLVSKEEVEPEQWKETVSKAVQTIKSEGIDKIVLARELKLTFNSAICAEAVLERLLKEQSSSFVFSLESGNACFIGATPERLVKKEGNEVLSTCLAGSIARGKTEGEDEQLGQELLHDPKNLMEHQFVVNMIRRTMETTCTEVIVPSSPILMKTKHIQHLYTPVRAVCENYTTILDLVKKLHPTPALGGLPQAAAVRWIRENELLERGLYGGPLGWIDSNGNGEFAVALRSALIKGNEASLFAGCGIVEDSKPEEEYQETWIKFKPMLNALGGV
ncbi:isochorismate synthase [Bacillus sp. AGMB 02131]|uniref:Isochorismate synthase MenF n=1 Tax=Peribacillus faecalis TaxID=2772559 RepID=A0A927HEJ9_9BACI|nr:isochorismate synthase [Peribacillus faecalis]MBD3110558.1 isochorismate synthase [Peribacillus faecalis]